MSALSKILRDTVSNGLAFWCPGCDRMHMVRIGEGPGPRWTYNGDAERPTFSPSILVKGRQMTAKGHADFREWLASGRAYTPPEFESVDLICHSFVCDGQIQFLGDCTHALAGQTVPIPIWPDEDKNLPF